MNFAQSIGRTADSGFIKLQQDAEVDIDSDKFLSNLKKKNGPEFIDIHSELKEPELNR